MNAHKKIILACLRLEARLLLRMHNPKIIGITGSVGKTSTKEAIATLFGEHFDVWKSPKSYNSAIGVPLAILGLENAWNNPLKWALNVLRGAWRIVSPRPYPEILVLEMGVDRPGDIDDLLGIVKPSIVAVTAIGQIPVHVEFFESPDALAEEKAKLVQALQENDYAILNADDDSVRAMSKNTKAKILTYGFGESSTVRASNYKLLVSRGKPTGLTFKLRYDNKTVPISVDGAFGRQHVYALLAAAAVGIAYGLNLIEISEGLGKYKVGPGRLRLIEGINKSYILDDTYNAAPLAVEAALEVLGEMPGTRKIAVLGDMLELGKYSAEEHRKVGELAKSKADLIVAVGIRAKRMEGAEQWFSSSEEAGQYLIHEAREGDIILVKGSQRMRMEKIVVMLMREPERASELLVRQEPYWKK